MTPQERSVLRAKVGTAYMAVQSEYRNRGTPEEIMPELIGALLSLTVFVAKKAGISKGALTMAWNVAMTDEWDRD